MSDEILKALYDETLVGNGPRVLELTRQGLEEGMTPGSMLFDASAETGAQTVAARRAALAV